MLADRIKSDLASSTGIHSSDSVIKHILAGAAAVQLCSTIYKNGHSVAESIANTLSAWMDRHGYSVVDQFRGQLNQANSETPNIYERLQHRDTSRAISTRA